MSLTQYLLKNNLLADMFYFSDSMQQDRTVRIVLNSFTYNHDKKHYILDYWEDSMAKHIRVLRVKTLTVFGFEYYKKVQRTINRDELFDFIDQLKLVSSKIYHPNKELPIDFSTNWVKDKNIFITGKLLSLYGKVMSIEKCLFPVIRMLGGNPQNKIDENTDILINLGKDLDLNGNKIPIANLIELMDLVESESNKSLSEIIGMEFLIYV